MKTALVLCSGGLDSTTLIYWLQERGVRLMPIFLDYGQHCVDKEWETLRRVLPTQGIIEPERIDVSGIFRGSRSRLIVEPDLWSESVMAEELYIPYRTLLFLSIGAACAQTRDIVDVYSGFINSNHAKELDCSTAFLNSVDALTENVGPVRFNMPFRSWSKSEVVAEAMRLGVPIGSTYSCQMFSDVPCGVCPNCVDRLNAIEANRGAI